jgi:adenine-specific DNA-methyltransferase
MAEQEFIKAGFTVVGTENNENKLLSFLRENYPNIIRDTEINLEELKTVLGLPIDEKVNGYGLNFVGRNFARAKYAQKTEKELHLNTTLSKNFDTTENLLLKGDNLDSLKILKNHYSGQIKCIYIDPPYNTEKDEFVYPDKFDKEEAEVLGLANLSESDYARMDFSFKTKKSHNGWLAFMYPRLLLARDLLNKKGVIFISIDDNEQANLKLLCDDIFGEENFVSNLIWKSGRTAASHFTNEHEYILCFAKNKSELPLFKFEGEENISDRAIKRPSEKNPVSTISFPKGMDFECEDKILPSELGSGEPIKVVNGIFEAKDGKLANDVTLEAAWTMKDMIESWIDGETVIDQKGQFVKRFFFKNNGVLQYEKEKGTVHPKSIISDYSTKNGTNAVKALLGKPYFDFPKPPDLLRHFFEAVTSDNDIILDFFAGSGTTGEAVMELNKRVGKRKFILCQIDEPIKEGKPAYEFCIDNNLPPVISSITIERLKRAGEKIAKEIEEANNKPDIFDEDKKQVPDIGFKIFDSAEAPKLKVDENGQISITENETDALSRIYNMIFTVGLDEPTQVPEEIVKDSIYKIGNHYYITNSEKISSDDYSNAIKNGKVFIDGWTASLNGTLQNYKEDVKIVF